MDLPGQGVPSMRREPAEQVLRKGLSPLATTISTERTTPVIWLVRVSLMPGTRLSTISCSRSADG